MRQLTALVIGNATYQNGGVLLNPVNDAESISAALTVLGFTVTKLTDATTLEMDRALESFGHEMESSDVGLFFFAGHAFQIDGSNFLAGVDTKADNKLNIQYSALHLDKVLAIMKDSASPSRIVILDACRDNPFDSVLYRSGASAELAQINAPRGTLIAFSTSPGQKSQDGSNKNGSYTEALLQHIATEDIPIETMFKRVRSTLDALTGGRQISWEHTSLTGDFRFRLKAETPTNGYARTALADSLYALHNKQPAHQLVRALKSYSWYTQNPALVTFGIDEAQRTTADDLFVIGRNIYQSACGSSNEAQKFIEAFLSRTEGLDEGKRKALLDGMLFEIFFDSEGQRRPRPKMGDFAEVFRLQRFSELGSSFEFIAANLRPYSEHYYVVPGSGTEVTVDVALDSPSEEGSEVTGVWYESTNILRRRGPTEPDVGLDRKQKFTRDGFRDFLSSEMIIPKHLLTIRFPTQGEDVRLIMPGDVIVRKDA